MRQKLKMYLTLVIFVTNSIKAQTYISGIPDWWLGSGWGSFSGDQFIPDLSTTKHVTSLELTVATDGAIFKIRIIGDGVTRTADPTSGCTTLSATKQYLNIGAYERVTKVDAYRNSNGRWYRLTLTLNNGLTREYNPTHAGTDTVYTFTVAAGKEFTGFQLMNDDSFNCQLSAILMIVRVATCSAVLDISSFNGLSQNVVSGVAQTVTLTNTPWECTSSLEYQLVVTPASATTNLISMPSSTSPNIVFAQTSNTADAATYTVTVNARQVGTSDWTQASATGTYTYNAASPCLTTTIAAPSLTAMTTSVLVQITPGGSPQYMTQTTTATNSVSIAQGVANYCGNYQYSITSVPISGQSSLSTSDLTIHATTGLISAYTANSAVVGQHTVTVTTGLVTYSAVSQVAATFTLEILPCIITSFTMSPLSPTYDQSYIIAYPASSWSIAGSSVTSQVPACAYGQTLTSASSPNFVNVIPGVSITYSAYSTSFSHDGTYTITLTSTLVNYNFVPAVTAPTCQSTFVLTVVASCDLSPTVIVAPIPLDLTTSVMVQSGGSPYFVSQTVLFKDTISIAKGDDFVTCANRQYSISSLPSAGTSALSSTELMIGSSTGLIQVYTSNSATIGTHTVTVTASLASYPTVAAVSATFSIQINACVVTAFSMVALSAQIYTIADPAFTWSFTGSLVLNQVPACGYTQTLTSTNAPAFVTVVPGATIFFTSDSRNFIDGGTHTVTVFATLDSYPYSQPTPPCQSNFALTVSSPCDTTIISMVPGSIENLVAFQGYNTYSQNKYVFNDTASFTRTLITDTQDFCGEKILTFTLNNTQTTLLMAKNGDYIVSHPLNNQNSIGISQAQVQASMKINPLILSSPISFLVTILGFQELELIPDQLYVLDSDMLEIDYEPFKVLPTDFNTGKTSITAYIFEGLSPPEQLDLTCSCLKKIEELNFIKHNETLKQIVVFTDDRELIGDHYVLLVQFFTNYPGVNPYIQIKISIVAAENQGYTLKRPPYFKPALLDQNITQCQSNGSKPWTFVLPRRIDPNYREVRVEASFNKTFFKFDDGLMKFTQLKIVHEPVNQTISLTLSNELNLTATYSMFIYFFCNQTQNITYNTTFKPFVKQIETPNMFIKKIEPSGLMHVKFSNIMKVPTHPEWIQTGNTTINQTIYPNLRIDVVKGKYSDFNLLELNNWTLVGFQPFQMLIQLNFTNKTYVSSHDTARENIKLTIYGYELFSDVKGNFIMPETELNIKQVPLLDSPSNIQVAQQQARIVQLVIAATLISNTLLSIIINGPLKTLLDSVEQVQTIVHVLLINVSYPATATVFFGMLMQVLTFQFYDFSDFYNRVFGLDDDSAGNEPLNVHFDLMGYSSLYLIQNFGTLCWTILIPIFFWLASALINIVSKGKFVRYKQKFNRIMFFDYWVLFFYENYIFLAMSAGLNLLYLRWQNYGDIFNSVIAVSTGFCVIVFPFFVAVFYNLTKNHERILARDDNFLGRFGSIISGLNFEQNGRLVFLYTCTTMFVQLWLACIVVFNQEKQVFNIIMVNMQALVLLTVAGYCEAMADSTTNKIHLVNQAFVLLFTYHLYQFTDYMTDLKIRNQVAMSLVVITLTNLALNFGVVYSKTLALCLSKAKLRYRRLQERLKIRKRKTTQDEQRKRQLELLLQRRQLGLQELQEERLTKQVNLLRPETHQTNSCDLLKLDDCQSKPNEVYSESNQLSKPSLLLLEDYQLDLLAPQQDTHHQDSTLMPVKLKVAGLGRIVVPMQDQPESITTSQTTLFQKYTDATLARIDSVEEMKEHKRKDGSVRDGTQMYTNQVLDQDDFGRLKRRKNVVQLRAQHLLTKLQQASKTNDCNNIFLVLSKQHSNHQVINDLTSTSKQTFEKQQILIARTCLLE